MNGTDIPAVITGLTSTTGDEAEMVAMLRDAASYGVSHHLAAINEIHVLTRRGLSDREFRAKVIEILDAVQQVNDEIVKAAEGGAR